MAWKNLAVGFALGTAAAVGAGFALSHATPASTTPASLQDPNEMMQDPEMMQEMMEKWMATTTPGPEHEWLAKGEGKWNVTMRMWMEGPGSEPVVSTGTAEAKMVLGGRYLMENFNATLNFPPEMGGQQPFEGLGMTGYDKVRNLYISTWADSMSTQIMMMKGSRAPGGDTLYLYGEMDEVMLNVYGRLVRSDIIWTDENTHTMTMYDLHAGPDYKVFEITYERAK